MVDDDYEAHASNQKLVKRVEIVLIPARVGQERVSSAYMLSCIQPRAQFRCVSEYSLFCLL